MRREDIIKSLKISIGVVIAILLGKLLKMEFYMTVTTIVIVSMLSQKKQSIKLAGIRLFAGIVSLALSSILFTIFGFSLAVFILYIFIFTLLMHRFDTKIAIVLNVVLVMHIYSLEEISMSILLNEFGLLVLGVLVSLVFNYFTIDIEDEIIDYQRQSESLFESIFANMGQCLINECRLEVIKEELKELDELLDKAQSRAYTYMNSYYIQENNYYVEFFLMERQQYFIVRKMQIFIRNNFFDYVGLDLLKDFTDNFIYSSKSLDTWEKQMKSIEEIKEFFIHKSTLPSTNKELENRIALDQYLYSLSDLIETKMRFIDKHEK